MHEFGSSDDDLDDLLAELRVLLLGAQLFTAFLMTLPFSAGFRNIVHWEKVVFLATFSCSIFSLVVFTAPAVQHRLMRPLQDRTSFKSLASRQMLIGAGALAGALLLGIDLVIAEVFGAATGLVASGMLAMLIALLWWLLPLALKRRRRE